MSELKTSKESESTVKAAKKAVAVDNFIYIGPTIPNTALVNGATVLGTRAQADKYFRTDEYPAVRALIVVSEDLAESRARLSQKGTRLNSV